MRWRVWAPRAAEVDLVLMSEQGQPTTHRMVRDVWGYHELTLPDIQAGERYAYRLDAGPMRPDPCSMWQPDGVHRASAVYFPEDFAWTDENWQTVKREDLVFYELHVGTFTPAGTLDAIIPRLESLKGMGITALEIMPLAQFPGDRNWGYDGAHLFAVQNSYGGPRALQRLVDAAHRVGLAVILDIVLNHFGPEGNYIGEFAPYYSSRYTTPWGPAFNFDGRDSDPVRDFVLDNVWQWIAEFHLDGLRLDAVHAMFDNSPLHILSEIKRYADEAAQTRGQNSLIIAESLMNDVRMVRSVEQGGYGLDAEWNEDFHHALFAFLTGERHGKYVDFGAAQQLPVVLMNTFHLSGSYSQFRRRRWGAPVGNIPGDRFVIGTQNHDHIGNRACGERLCQLLNANIQRLCASLMLLSPYLPLIFMGEEYGEPNPFLFFCSFEDQGLIENVRQGRARDYALEGAIPDPQAVETFQASKLSWAWQGRDFQAGLRQLYCDLLEARRTWPALGDYQVRSSRLWPDDKHTTVLELIRGGTQHDQAGALPTNIASNRSHSPPGGGALACYFNLTDRPQPIPYQLPTCSECVALFRSEQHRYGSTGEFNRENDAAQLKPHECIVFGPGSWKKYVE